MLMSKQGKQKYNFKLKIEAIIRFARVSVIYKALYQSKLKIKNKLIC